MKIILSALLSVALLTLSTTTLAARMPDERPNLHIVDSFQEYVGERLFIFHPAERMWYAYQGGQLVGMGKASGGKSYCADVGRACTTPVGKFKVYLKKDQYCVSSKYPLDKSKPRAKMPYCMFFKGGYAIHGSNSVPQHNASHGCVRVHPEAAQWLHTHFIKYGTKVIVNPY